MAGLTARRCRKTNAASLWDAAFFLCCPLRLYFAPHLQPVIPAQAGIQVRRVPQRRDDVAVQANLGSRLRGNDVSTLLARNSVEREQQGRRQRAGLQQKPGGRAGKGQVDCGPGHRAARHDGSPEDGGAVNDGHNSKCLAGHPASVKYPSSCRTKPCREFVSHN